MKIWMLWLLAVVFLLISSICYLLNGNYDLAREYTLLMMVAIILMNQYREK